jgi:hypothetical protein
MRSGNSDLWEPVGVGPAWRGYRPTPASAAYFWANLLLPLELGNRADWEMHSLFLVWLALFLHAALRPATRLWAEQSGLAAAAFALLPPLNALTTDRHLAASLPAGDWVFAGFDLAILAIGLVFTAVAWHLNRKARFVRREPDALPARAPRKQVGVAE